MAKIALIDTKSIVTKFRGDDCLLLLPDPGLPVGLPAGLEATEEGQDLGLDRILISYRVVLLTGSPLNFLSTGSHGNWPEISLSVSSYKGILYLEKNIFFWGGGQLKEPPCSMIFPDRNIPGPRTHTLCM